MLSILGKDRHVTGGFEFNDANVRCRRLTAGKSEVKRKEGKGNWMRKEKKREPY